MYYICEYIAFSWSESKKFIGIYLWIRKECHLIIPKASDGVILHHTTFKRGIKKKIIKTKSVVNTIFKKDYYIVAIQSFKQTVSKEVNNGEKYETHFCVLAEQIKNSQV